MSRFGDARADIHGDSWLDKLARASLMAAEAKFEKRRPSAFLAVDVSRNIDADVMSVIASNMQNAVARMGRHLTDPKSTANVVYESDRDRARLYPRRQIGRRIEFGFEDLDVATLFENPSPASSIAERAAVELVSVLPESSADTAAVESMLAHDRPLLNVIRDVVKAVESSAGVGLTVSTSAGGQTAGVLTREQATSISIDLSEGDYERQVIPVDGRLDGMRTRRRIFYIEAPGRDYEGVYELDLGDTVKRYIDKPVQAAIERVRMVRQSGKPGRWSYRLLSLADRPTDPGLF